MKHGFDLTSTEVANHVMQGFHEAERGDRPVEPPYGLLATAEGLLGQSRDPRES